MVNFLLFLYLACLFVCVLLSKFVIFYENPPIKNEKSTKSYFVFALYYKIKVKVTLKFKIMQCPK